MGLNFYDYLNFQKNQGGYKIMKHTVLKTKQRTGAALAVSIGKAIE